MSISLRWYQEEAVAASLQDWAENCPDNLVSMPTATGKTYFFTGLMAAIWRPGIRILVIAHTEELVKQPYESFVTLFSPEHPKAKLGFVQARNRQYSADVIFATVQTLSQDGYKPLFEILKHGKIDYLVIDETHHIVANTYIGVKARLISLEGEALGERVPQHHGWKEGKLELEALRQWLEEYPELVQKTKQECFSEALFAEEFEALEKNKRSVERKIKRWGWIDEADYSKIEVNPDLLSLGVTATPYRTDNVNLALMFPKIFERDRFTYMLTIRDAIEHNILADVEVIYVETNYNSEKLFDDGSNEDKTIFDAENGFEMLIDRLLIEMNKDKLPIGEYIFEEHHELVLSQLLGGELQVKAAIWFMPTVDISKQLITVLKDTYKVISAGHIDGTGQFIYKEGEVNNVNRDAFNEMFKAEEFKWASNNLVMTEGYDAPHVHYGVIARSTGSLTLYVQMLGRYLRKDPNDPNKVARVLQPDYYGHKISDITSLIGDIPTSEVDRIEKMIEELSAGGHMTHIPPCNECGGELERLRGTRTYRCQSCQTIFDGDELNDGLDGIFSEKTISGRGTFAKYIELFAESEVAWYKENGIWSVSIGVNNGSSQEPQAQRTILILPPEATPMRPGGYNLVEFRKPVISKQMVGRWKKYPKYKHDSPEGAFIGPVYESMDPVLDIASDRISRLREPKLSSKDEKWRSDPISPGLEKQLIGRFNLPEGKVQRLNKGDAARIYAHYEALEYLRKKGVID